MSYSLLDYGWMLWEGPRFDAHVEALKRTVKPGDVVLEVGAGFGFFSVLAAKLGAAHVYAVEPDVAIHVGKNIARDNGVADRVTFMQARMEEVSVPEVDVVIADLRGVLPQHTAHFAALRAARAKLKPGGALIPWRDRIMVAATDDAHLARGWSDPWRRAPCGVSLEAALPFVTQQWARRRARPESLMTAAAPWCELDYRTLAGDDTSGSARLVAERDGVLRGLLVWVEAELVAGVGFSAAPGQPELPYPQVLFPVHEPRELRAGDVVQVDFATRHAANDHDWQWRIRVFSAGGADQPRVDERHHSMLGLPLLPQIRAGRTGDDK